MFKEFKEFAMRGNAIDMAVGIIIGASFGNIITSLVNDIIMPPIGLILGRVDFTNLFINLSSIKYTTLVEAKTAGAATLNYGLFLNNILDFIIVAFAIFLIIKQLNKFKTKPKTVQTIETTKTCPFCISLIPINATRCPFCTSEIKA